MALTETENNAYAKFLGDEQRALWYVVRYFLEWSKPEIHWASTPRAYWSQGSQILVVGVPVLTCAREEYRLIKMAR